MKRLFALLPVAGLIAGSFLSASVLMSSTAAAQACQVDGGGGCKSDGAKCNPPNGGKCWTVKERRVLKCVCAVNKPPNALRSVRPRPNPPPTEPVG